MSPTLRTSSFKMFGDSLMLMLDKWKCNNLLSGTDHVQNGTFYSPDFSAVSFQTQSSIKSQKKKYEKWKALTFCFKGADNWQDGKMLNLVWKFSRIQFWPRSCQTETSRLLCWDLGFLTVVSVLSYWHFVRCSSNRCSHYTAVLTACKWQSDTAVRKICKTMLLSGVNLMPVC